ncbi:MAG: hypothetical protein JWP91_3645 [Fibrobacteres bacterium]|nr:hypothetical protein [Fibrobacterota bacterium]
MANEKQKIVDRFFEAYGKRDFPALKQVVSENVTWYFLGRHPYAGIKKGIEEVVSFFDTMGRIMSKSRPTVVKPIVSENDEYLIECVHTRTNRPDGPNIDHQACILWKFKDGRIVEGRHFFADPQAADRYFTAVAEAESSVPA